MLVKCPSCNTEYDCEPGRYRCPCGAEFSVPADDEASVSSKDDRGSSAQPDIDSPDVTIPPSRTRHSGRDAQDTSDVTIPSKRGRKADGRFEAGDVILGRYKVISELGQGGMGVVYKCFDETAGIVIALKALPPELSHNSTEMEDVKENFQLVSRLVHQNIAIYRNLEKDEATGNYYLIMECVEGEDLRHWIKRKRRETALTADVILPIIRQVASALDYAHKQRIIHRDIKPGNIMIDAEGQVKVLDFGLAAQIHTSLTRVSMAYQGTSGTAPYMAPEQWRGKLQGAPADQYALAVMTYEMFAGHLPFENADATVLREAVLNETPDPIPGIPAHVQAALMRGMSKTPGDRFGSCMEFTAALGGEKVSAPSPKVEAAAPAAPVTPDVPVSPAAPAAGSKPDGKAHLKRVTVLVIVALLVLAGGIVGWFLSGGRSDPEDETASRPAREKGKSTSASASSPEPVSSSEPVSSPEVTSRSNEDSPNGNATPGSLAPGDKTIALPNGQKLELVKVDAGSFMMSVKDGENYPDEVEHQATLKQDFYLANTEVTQAQWRAVMGTDPSNSKGDDLPVEKVSWNDAMAFCGKLNEMDKAPEGWTFTLPTETQWEFAARGGNRSRGYKFSGSDNLDEVAWYGGNSDSETHPVGGKNANELGLYDMSGNVSEWCLDDYWSYESGMLTAEFVRGNDNGGMRRSIRGGSWINNARGCRSAIRYNFSPNFRDNYAGFRPALVPYVPPGLTITLSDGVALNMMKVEAGTFTMSAFDGENESSEVSHQVTLTKAFFMGQTEVTQAQWKAVMGTNPSNFKGDDLPVENVSWNDAMDFCGKLNSMGKVPDSWKFTLPTETQWEYAARGGRKSQGYKFSGSNDVGEVAWYGENSGDRWLDESTRDVGDLESHNCKTHPVGQKKANELGLYDMSGNVAEWCLDNWNRESNTLQSEFSRGKDSDTSLRANRGGAWSFLARFCRNSRRSNYAPDSQYKFIGFRVVLVPVQ